jgi:uncharacterized protein YggE
MIRTKAALAVVACMAGIAAGSIAAAQADSSGTGTTGATGATGAGGAAATITVNGSGTVTADPSVTGSAAQADYLTALGNALTDAHTHATTLAGAIGDTLGAVQNITEQSNDEACSGLLFAAGTAKSGAPAPAVSPGTSKKKHHSKPKKAARIALPMSAVAGAAGAGGTVAVPAIAPTPAIPRTDDVVSTSCSIEASVTVTYAMSPS